MSGDGGARAQARQGPCKLQRVVESGCLEVVEEEHPERVRNDSNFWSSFLGRPSRADDHTTVAPSPDQLPDPFGMAPTLLQECFVAAANGHSVHGGFVNEDNHLRMRGCDDYSSSRAAHKDKPAYPTAVVVNDSAVGSDLPGRGKRDREKAEPATLQWLQGADRHATGNPMHCVYHNAEVGFASSTTCGFGQAPPTRKDRARPSKASRLQCKRVAEMLDNLEGQQGIGTSAGSLGSDIYCEAMSNMCPVEQRYLRRVLSARSGQTSGQSVAMCDKRLAIARSKATASPEQALGSESVCSPSRDRPRDCSEPASTSVGESVTLAVDDHGSRGGFVGKDGHHRLRGWDDRSSSRSCTAAHKDKPAGPTADVVNDSVVGTNLELAKLQWSECSESHATGNCMQCVYHNAEVCFASGTTCELGHAPPTWKDTARQNKASRKNRARQNKASRLQCKEMATMLVNLEGQQGVGASAGSLATDAYREVVSTMCSVEQRYMHSVLSARSGQTSGQRAALGGQRLTSRNATACPEQALGSESPSCERLPSRDRPRDPAGTASTSSSSQSRSPSMTTAHGAVSSTRTATQGCAAGTITAASGQARQPARIVPQV